MGALDGARDPATEPALRTLDAALKWLEGRFPRPTSENAHDVAQAAVVLSAAVSEASSGRVPVAALDLEAPLAAQVEDYRKRLTADRAPRGGSNEVPVDPAVLAAAAGTTRRAVSESVTYGLRQIVRERGDRLRHLEYELTSALSQTLAHERGALAPSEISP
jgi:hypothetical protein